MPKTPPDFVAILSELADHQVDFIVVGGVCAILHGTPINTADVDIVHSRDPANLDRLAAALQALNASYRHHPKRISPTASMLASAGHNLLTTNAGPLDVLGTIADDQGYEELEPFSVTTVIDLTLSVQILSLDKLIEVKEKTRRPKHQAAPFQLLPVLKDRQDASKGEGGTTETSPS